MPIVYFTFKFWIWWLDVGCCIFWSTALNSPEFLSFPLASSPFFFLTNYSAALFSVSQTHHYSRLSHSYFFNKDACIYFYKQYIYIYIYKPSQLINFFILLALILFFLLKVDNWADYHLLLPPPSPKLNSSRIFCYKWKFFVSNLSINIYLYINVIYVYCISINSIHYIIHTYTVLVVYNIGYFDQYSFFSFLNFILYWNIVVLQCCVSFMNIAK